ncbi:hypothetical protein FRC08_015306 [Ceratobasidium sp. 394]|nr:hypothetical protein FRC08_015306 [Ceratobasidium sp. 394]
MLQLQIRKQRTGCFSIGARTARGGRKRGQRRKAVKIRPDAKRNTESPEAEESSKSSSAEDHIAQSDSETEGEFDDDEGSVIHESETPDVIPALAPEAEKSERSSGLRRSARHR